MVRRKPALPSGPIELGDVIMVTVDYEDKKSRFKVKSFETAKGREVVNCTDTVRSQNRAFYRDDCILVKKGDGAAPKKMVLRKKPVARKPVRKRRKMT